MFKKLSGIKLRIMIGIIMNYSFLCLAFFIYWWMSIDFNNRISYIVVLFQYFYLWVPTVALIFITYWLLMYVFKYDGDKCKVCRLRGICNATVPCGMC